jgi:nucleotide-binding universal stress UspA family protein
MFNRILVAINHSSVVNQQVFDQALSLAKGDQGNLILLHVLSIEEEHSPLRSAYTGSHRDRYIHDEPQIIRRGHQGYDPKWSDGKQQGIKLLRSFAQKAIAAGITTEFGQITGHPSSTICEFAQLCHADVIVMGRKEYLTIKEIFLGSVSNYVLHNAPCSVLLVRMPMLENSTPLYLNTRDQAWRWLKNS